MPAVAMGVRVLRCWVLINPHCVCVVSGDQPRRSTEHARCGITDNGVSTLLLGDVPEGESP